MSARFDRPFLCAVLLAGALVLSISDGADPDLWGHVRYGADVLHARQLPTTTTYAYTAAEHPWINHEIASELAFAALAALGGGTALTALKLLCGLALLALLIGHARRAGATPLVIALTSVLAAVNLSPGWTVRPQIFSYTAFAIMIALLDRGSVWLLPVLFLIWVNTHAGFVAGLFVLAVHLAVDVAERVWRGDATLPRAAVRAAAVLLACSATILCTPYGRAFVPWLAGAITLARPAISEWQPMTWHDPQFVPFVLLLGAFAVAWWRTPLPRPFATTAVVLVVAWASARHSRHAPFLAILGGLWLPAHYEAMRRRPAAATPPDRSSGGGERVVTIAAWGACAVLALAVVTRVRPPWVHRTIYPVDAFAFMQTHGLTGKLMAQFDWAQYALYAFAPATSVAFDGRFETAYPETVADAHFDFLLGDVPERAATGDPARILDLGAPDLVLVNRAYPNAVATMANRQEWTLLYRDGLAELWGRARRYDDPASAAYLAPADRIRADRIPAGRVPWPALP
jgi:hypothetical protein